MSGTKTEQLPSAPLIMMSSWVKDLAFKYSKHTNQGRDNMQCPKCDAEMEDVEIYNVIIERCSSCKGLWFDHAKHEFLKDQEDADEIDTGDPEYGKVFDKKGEITCPSCSATMIKMVVADQPHIHYESCSQCFSVFFDAGEFKDFVVKDIVSFFKDLMAKER